MATRSPTIRIAIALNFGVRTNLEGGMSPPDPGKEESAAVKAAVN
jgi:hypothetical protein